MGEYAKISENVYKNKKHHYLIKCCEYCNSDFFCRKDKMNKKTCNSICYQKFVEKNKKYEIGEPINDIIIGSLLSDGSINNSNNGKNYFWTHMCINEDYIDLLIKETNIRLNKFSTESKPFVSTINGETYLSKKSYTLKSMASTTFTKYRKEWYPNGIKIVPHSIKLTPIVVLHWYIGDGSISDSNGITLCTDSFDESSIFFLLQELLQLNFDPIHSEKRNRIIIPNRRVREFLSYIGKCPVESYEYKWNSILKSYLGRSCINCGNIFDAIYNHQKYCNPRCTIIYSNKSLKKSNQPFVL